MIEETRKVAVADEQSESSVGSDDVDEEEEDMEVDIINECCLAGYAPKFSGCIRQDW